MQDTDSKATEKKAIIWDEWQNGSPMSKIAQLICTPPATVFSYLRDHGGIQPRERIRSRASLRLEEREEISRGLAANQSIRAIASHLNRSPSTISREINWNGGGCPISSNGRR